MEHDQCNATIIHKEVIDRVRNDLPDEETLYRLADIFKVLGDPTRIRILTALSSAEMCGCDLSVLLGVTTSAISHQLRLLRQARLVKFRKDGKVVYYSLDDSHVEKMFRQGLEHVSE